MGLNNLNKQNLSKKIKYHFPIVYLLFKPNKQMFKNIKGFRSIKKNNLFDEEFYLSNYKDVKASGMNPIIHYIIYGYKEGKDPNKDFDGVYYSLKNSGVYQDISFTENSEPQPRFYSFRELFIPKKAMNGSLGKEVVDIDRRVTIVE